MEEIKLNEIVTMYKAPKGEIFIHKEKGVNLFGEVVIVNLEVSEHRIEDFKLITQEQFDELNKQNN